jgi:hypothetical protein
MLLRRCAAALSTAVLVVAIAGSNGGIAQAAPNQAGERGGPNLSTPEAAKTYLSSLGFDPSKFIFQVGLKNYSGPACPGLDWNCTGAPLVVQIALAGGENYAECAENVRQCVIVQGSNTQLVGPLSAEGDVNMHAHCPPEGKRLTLKESGALECTITQINDTTGNNHAVVGMSIHDNDGPAQDGHEDATVTQSTHGDGDNHAVVHEEIALHTNDESDQVQDGFQSLNLTQDVLPDDAGEATGDNFADVKQTQDITAVAQSPATTQKQNTEEETDPCLGPSTNANTCIRFEQTTGTGNNDLNIHQDHNVDAAGAGGQQNQGCASKECTLEVDGFQHTASTSVNSVDDHQSVTYTLRGPGGTTQIQDPRIANGPGEQIGGPSDLWKVTQLAVLNANDADDVGDIQAHINEVNDTSSGTVDAQSVIIINGERSEIVCNFSSCNYTQACGEFDEELEITTFCPAFSDETPID